MHVGRAHLQPIKSNFTVFTPTSNNTSPRTTLHRKSWICEPITEEPSGFDPSIDDPEVFQRHHRTRAPLPRTQSAPHLISTTTTQPIHIHNIECVNSLPLSFYYHSYPSFLLAWLILSIFETILTLLVLEARAISISKQPPPALQLKQCATRLVTSLAPSKIISLKRFHSIRFHPRSMHPTHIPFQAFDTEMQSFFYIFTRYLAERAKSQDL